MPDTYALAPPLGAAATANPLVVLVIGVALFAVVVVVIAVVMTILQAVLPKVDTGAEEVHRRELEEQAAAGAEEGSGEADASG